MLCTSALLVSQASAQELKRADVIHWWTSESEAKSAKVFSDAFKAAGGEWVDAAVAGTDAAKAAAATRIQAGDPPAAVVYNSVKDIDDLVKNGQISTLDDVAGAGNWKANMPAAILNAVTRDGHVYGAPINLGVNNYLWSSPIALAKVGVTEPPKTWEEFFAVGDKLKQAGVIPFAQSGMWYWYLMTFGNVLATQSTDAYTKFHVMDPSVFEMPEFKKAVEIFARLREYSDSGVPGREWNLSNAMVMRGEAAFQLMGDWAKGEILAGGMTPGKDVLCTVGLDNSPVSISGDILAFPVNTNENTVEAQKLLAKVVTTPEVQLAYSLAKGSLPVRTDIEGAAFDTCARVAVEQQAAHSSVPGYPVLLSPDAAGSIADVLGNFWVDTSASGSDLIGQLEDGFSSLN
ncbi:hypothetical protein ASC96_18545 [Rhizobium sp. Root1204]|nr:hypothetical protein ASC96_18545 [Rhizobium sp. Root1204]